METIETNGSPLLVTLDTGVLDDVYDQIARAASALPIDVEFVTVTVADRERGAHESRPEVGTIYETLVLDVSPFGSAVLASDASAALFEQIRAIVSSGSYQTVVDGEISDGHRSITRDVMILEAHVREGRDVFVTTDRKAFINHERRQKLEALCSTRIMTPEEFVGWCAERYRE